MIQLRFRIAASCLIVAGSNAPAIARQSGGASTSSPQILAADLRRQVEALASDEMQGRSTGTKQAMDAARYLAGELKRMGVAPGGETGTYFQKVPMGSTEYLAIPTLEYAGADGASVSAVAGVDFEMTDGGAKALALKTIFAASASEIPKQADASVALVLLSDKAKDRAAWLESAGMPGGAGFGLVIGLGAKTPGMKPMDAPPRVRPRLPGPTPRITVRGTLREAFEARKPATVRFSAPFKSTELESVNVIGKIAGVGTASDKSIANEVIEFSAHYDHLPPRTDVAEGQDKIFNGADDDASGCAVVLELAEAFAQGPKPARTLLFFFATGEEIGLVGSSYSLEHPLVPLDKLVLDLNFEMLGRPDPLVKAPACMWLTGFERSDLGEMLQKTGVPVVADMRPAENFFQRSDNYALAMRGIVAQTLSSFGGHKDYHQVSDEPATLDYTHMQACASGALVGSRALADGSFRPKWREGLDPSMPSTGSKQRPPEAKAGDKSPDPKPKSGG